MSDKEPEVFEPSGPILVMADETLLGFYVPMGKYWLQTWGVDGYDFIYGPLGNYFNRQLAVERIKDAYLGSNKKLWSDNTIELNRRIGNKID